MGDEGKKMAISIVDGKHDGKNGGQSRGNAAGEQRPLFSKLPPPKENGIIKLKKATEEFALKSGQLIQNYESIASEYDHKVRMMLLFKMWAPLYDAYWILTRHEEAARQVIKQLDSVGEDKSEMVFMGRGLEIGAGTGLVAHELGRLKERLALRRLADGKPAAVTKLAQECVKQQNRMEYLLTDPRGYEKEFPYEVKQLLLKISKILENDCMKMSSGLTRVIYQVDKEDAEFRPIFKQYEMLRRMLDDRRTMPSTLLEDEDIKYLMRFYIRTLSVARKILEDMDNVRSADKMELLFELRKKLNTIMELTAIDISGDMIQIAREKVRDVYGGEAEGSMFREEDGTTLTERALLEGWADTFDFVVISQLLHIVPDEDKKKILMGAHTALKPGGKLALIDEWSPLFSGESLESADHEVKFLISQLELLFRFTFHPITEKGAMRKLIEDAGFEYSKERASKNIDDKHSMYGHIYLKKEE